MANLLQRLKGLLSGVTASQSAGGLLGSIMQGGVAPRRGSRELLDAYRTSPWLHAVVHRIAQEVAGVPLRVYQTPAKREPVGKARVSVTRGAVRYAPPGAQELETHPLLDLLDNPNPAMTRGVFFYLLAAYLDVKGEVPVVVERSAAGEPIELWVVPPTWLVDLPRAGCPFYRFSHGSWQRAIPEQDVIFMRHPDLSNPYARGIGIGETLADEIDIDEFATHHVKNWFFNRALPDVFLYVEGVRNEAEAQRYEEKLRQRHGGRGKANQVHVTNGKVELKQVGHTFREQMLPELRDQSRDFILQIYSMPPEAMGIIENSNRATIDAAMYLLMRGVVVPRLSFIADALTAWARANYADRSLAVGFDSPVPEDAAFSLSVMQAQPSLFTKNEWRALAGTEPIDGWDDELAERPAASAFAPPGLPAGEEPEAEEPEEESEEPEEKAKRGRSLRRRWGAALAQ